MRTILIAFMFLISGCNTAINLGNENITRAFAFLYGGRQTTSKTYLSIKGQIKDKDGKPTANSVMSLNSNNFSSSLSVRATDEIFRCTDYNLNQNSIQCLVILKTGSFSVQPPFGIYYGKNKEKVRKVAVISFVSSNTIQFVLTEKIPKNVDSFLVFQEKTGTLIAEKRMDDVGAGAITDKNGNYELKLAIGQVNKVEVKNPTSDMGSMSFNLTQTDTIAKAEELAKSPEKLEVTTSSELKATVEISGVAEVPVTSNEETTVASTNPEVTLDPAIILGAASAANVPSTTTITPTVTAPSATYTGSPYIFTNGTAIPAITPTITGTVTGCKFELAPPAGLVIDSTTCVITGTPTTVLPATDYTIVVSNLAGSVNATVNITVNSMQTVATPILSLATGTYNADQTVTLSTTTAGASIYYTLDGTTPTTGSTLYSGAISVAGHGTIKTIKTIAAKVGMVNSIEASSIYTINYNAVAMPTFSVGTGTYTGTQSVTITSSTGGASIRYTTNGTTPTCSTGTVYSVSVSVSTVSTLKAIACNAGMLDSTVGQAAYTIQYAVGGTVSGLTGTVVLQNNGGDNKSITADGAYAFTTPISNGVGYNVTVSSQPAGKTCTVSNPSATMGTANASNVNITCVNMFTIGGTVSGLTGTVVLQNNGGDNKSITADGTYTFTTAISNNSAYSVTVFTQPGGQTCLLSGGSGTATANVSNVNITCVTTAATRNWGTFTDLLDGTVRLVVNAGTWGGNTYTAKTLYFAKCSHGQTYDSINNTCTGSATAVQYCDTNDNTCNGGTDTGMCLVRSFGSS